MADPYIEAFVMPDGMVLTGVVMDQDDFDALCDELVSVAGPGTAAFARRAKLIALVKSPLTERLFDRWGAETDIAYIVVRGAALYVMKRILGAA